MPTVVSTLPDIPQSVSRPIMFDIINQIQDITKIDKKAKIFYPGDINKMQQGGSSIDDSNRDSVMANNKIVFIEVEEEYDLDNMSTTAVTYNEHIPVFNDPALGIMIVPIYTDSAVTINFKYKTRSKSEAMRWRDDIRVHVSAMRDINLHNCTYHYLLPDPFLQLLNDIHILRENIAGYGDTFPEWFKRASTSRLTLVGDLTNKLAKLAISETQTRIVGLYGFDSVPEKPERDDATGNWTISFSYKFTYSRPTACRAIYPVMVHNQLLPKEYIAFNDEVPNDPTKKNLSFTKSLAALNHFEQQSILKRQPAPSDIFRIPRHDEFVLMNQQPFTGTVFTALCEADLETQKEVLNFSELGDLMLDPDILDFIRKSEYPYITQMYQSVIQVMLYRGPYPAGNDALVCDRDLNLRTKHVQNLRINHRVRFSLVTDLSFLPKQALQRMKAYPNALLRILEGINAFAPNKSRTNASLDLLNDRNNPVLMNFLKTLGHRKTVQTNAVISYKRS